MNVSRITNNISSVTKNIAEHSVKPSNLRKFLTKFGKSDVLLPIIMLEATVTAGRAIQANKRGGYTESRERLFEDTISAGFWLFGVTLFNKIGDWIGKNIFKSNVAEFDAGKDALRTPLDNLAQSLGDVSDGFKKKLAIGKFRKIILSVLAAVGFIGIVLPKINQSITKKMLDKNSDGDKNQPVKQAQTNSTIQGLSLDLFKNKVADPSNRPSFGSALPAAEFFSKAAHNLENHAVYKLMATDVGIVSGRASNARNNDERVEIIFRDSASSFFYYFSTPLVVKGLQKLGNYGNVSKLDPTSALNVHNELVSYLAKAGGAVSVNDFESQVLGVKNNLSLKSAKILEKINFKDNVASLDDVKKAIPKSKYKLAEAMSGLQPAKTSVKMLTRRQVEDVLSGGVINNPKFLTDIYSQKFGSVKKGKFINNLTDPNKFIAMKDINKFRGNIDDYVNTVIQYAKDTGKKSIDFDVLKEVNNKNLKRTVLQLGAGFIVSALFLSTIIPKVQYMITKKRTGKDQFPGVEEVKKNN